MCQLRRIALFSFIHIGLVSSLGIYILRKFLGVLFDC